jgi:hypothetical protein
VSNCNFLHISESYILLLCVRVCLRTSRFKIFDVVLTVHRR